MAVAILVRVVEAAKGSNGSGRSRYGISSVWVYAMLTFASLHSQYKGSVPLTWKRYSFLYNNALEAANSIDRWFQFTLTVLKIQRANCFCVKPLVFDREWYSRVGSQSCALREHI